MISSFKPVMAPGENQQAATGLPHKRGMMDSKCGKKESAYKCAI